MIRHCPLGGHRTPAGETRLCPVCDSEIFADARVCDFCQTDLRLFDVDAGASPETPAKPPTNIDALIDSIAEGKEVKPEFFEGIRDVGKGSKEGKPMRSGRPGPSGAMAALKFECPECGAQVDGDVAECPHCGAVFAEESVEQFECPACRATVSPDASSCPNCGVAFAAEPVSGASREATAPAKSFVDLGPPEEDLASSAPARPELQPVPEVELRARIAAVRTERARAKMPVEVADKRALYRELPKLVNAVKPLLLGAKRAGVDIDDQKKLINDAIASGKSRDIEKAVRLVSQAKKRLEDAFALQLADRAEALVVEVERAKGAGGAMAPVASLLGAAIEPLEAGRYLEAADRLALAREEFEGRAGGYHHARTVISATESFVEDARSFGVEARDADRLLRLCRDAFGRQDWDSAANFAEQARSVVRQILPGVLEGEMKRARNALLDLKVRGADLTRPIGILKQASIHMKRDEFVEAMRYVRMYRKEIETVELKGPHGR